MIEDPTTHIVIFLWGFIPPAVWAIHGITMHSWENRWHQRFRGQKPDDSNWDEEYFYDSDWAAFWDELTHRLKNKVDWKFVIGFPISSGICSLDTLVGNLHQHKTFITPSHSNR